MAVNQLFLAIMIVAQFGATTQKFESPQRYLLKTTFGSKGLIFVDGQLEDKPVRLLLDTGAAVSLLRTDYLSKSTENGPRTLSIGSLKLSHLFEELDSSTAALIRKLDPQCVGILGSDSLAEVRLGIDYANRSVVAFPKTVAQDKALRIWFSSEHVQVGKQSQFLPKSNVYSLLNKQGVFERIPGSEPNAVTIKPMRIEGDWPLISAYLGNEELELVLDTGTTTSVLPQNIAKRRKFERVGKVMSVSPAHEGVTDLVLVPQFGLSSDVRMVLKMAVSLEPPPSIGIVGTDVLAKSKWLVDYVSETVAYQLNGEKVSAGVFSVGRFRVFDPADSLIYSSFAQGDFFVKPGQILLGNPDRYETKKLPDGSVSIKAKA